MTPEVIVALITSISTLAGVIITVAVGQRNTAKKMKEQSDLTLYRIEQLEKKQDKHNNLIERMYTIEEGMKVIEERQKVANHRIDDLEHKAS